MTMILCGALFKDIQLEVKELIVLECVWEISLEVVAILSKYLVWMMKSSVPNIQ